MARVLVTRRLPDGGTDPLLAAGHELVARGDDTPYTHAELVSTAGSVDAIVCLLTDGIDAAVLEAGAGRLRVVANVAVGYDNVDVAAAERAGIAVCNTPGVLDETTADAAFLLILAAARLASEAEADLRAGRWPGWGVNQYLGRDVHGAVLGVVGFGRIGQAVARRLEGFGCELLHTSRRDGVDLEELLERSDFVTLHCPLTPETRGLIGAEALRRMKTSAYVVNTARGPIVDSEALRAALVSGEIAGAALDVTDPEPLPRGHPLLDAPNLIVIPHLGSATHATRERMADMAVDNLLAGLADERMPHCANPEVYEAATRR